MESSYYDPAADAVFSRPYIDLEQWREQPIHHLYMHGGFEGTILSFPCIFRKKLSMNGAFFIFWLRRTARKMPARWCVTTGT